MLEKPSDLSSTKTDPKPETILIESAAKPPISIFISEDSNSNQDEEDHANNNDSMKHKCHSMLNMKQIKKNIPPLLPHQEILTTPCRFNYQRKCLSRINLNAACLQTNDNNNNNNNLSNNTSSILKSNNLKLIKNSNLKKSLNQLNLLGCGPLKITSAKKLYLDKEDDHGSGMLRKKTSVSIMNLECCMDKMGIEKTNNLFSNMNNKAGQTNLFASTTNPFNNSYLLLKSSNLNLYKSSTSLNALDLELLDSVSVGSFDRQSLYSNCANSECELNNFYLINSPAINNNDEDDGFSENSNQKGGLFGAAESLYQLDTTNKKKVISWLQNI